MTGMIFAEGVTVLQHIRSGALCGLANGLLLAVLDIAFLPAEDRGMRLSLVLGGIILSSSLVAGACFGLAVACTRGIGRSLARGNPRSREHLIAGSMVALVASPAVFLLVQNLASGRRAARILGPLWIQLAMTTVGVALGALVIWGSLRLRDNVLQERRPILTALIGVMLIGITVALFTVDALLYRRLYEYLHQMLMLIYLVTGLMGFLSVARGVWRGRRVPGPRWLARCAGAVLVTAVLVMGWWVRSWLEDDQRLRFGAMELSTVAAKVLSVVPLKTGMETPLFLESVARTHGRMKTRYQVPGANVVIVSVDALRADHLGIIGYRRPVSPNIDAVARGSVLFESAYCQAPLTCYSVPSLLTGDYLKSTLPLLSKPPPTLAQILGAKGYTTAAFYNASIFFCDDKRATSYGDKRFGFTYAETRLREAEVLTGRVLDYIESFRGSGKERLFLWVHYFDVHEPYNKRAEHDFGPRSVDRYDGEIAYTDRAIGRLVASLHQLPGPTIFVLTADHGEEFKEHGGNYHGSTLYEEQIRVPLIIGVPGLKPQVMRTPVQLVDVVPTILSLLGIRIPESVRGRTLVPELMGQGDPDRTAFSEVHTKKMVRFRHWKLIHDFRRSTFELYDLLTDGQERINLIGRRPREMAHLKGLLHGWFDMLQGIGGSLEEDRPEGIDLGRIGDRRSVPLLARLLLDPDLQSRWRQEAALLLGQIQDRRGAEPLWMTVADDDRQVATEAAIALGEIKDKRALLVLPYYLRTTLIEQRMRAAIALARVDSPEATPALIEAMYGDNWEIQNRAAHYLGFVGDRRAIDPLLRLSSRLQLRSRIALALGRIGRRFPDRRLVKVLLDMARGDSHADVRQRALGGLGFLGDRRAVRHLADLMATEPDLTWTPETLSRLGGIGGYWAPGVDFSPARKGLKEGWGRCSRNPSESSDHYLGRTWCATIGSSARVEFTIKQKPFPAQLLLRFRPVDPRSQGASLTLVVNGRSQPALAIDRGWRAVRLQTPSRHWRQGKNEVRFRISRLSGPRKEDSDGLLALDYLVLAAPERWVRKRVERSRSQLGVP